MGVRSANDTPVLANALPAAPPRTHTGRRFKRARPDDDDDMDSDVDDEDGRPVAKRGLPKKEVSAPHDYEMDNNEADGGADGEVDSKVYCTCRQVSYGEMIGCDDDDCEIEWVSHVLMLEI